MSYNNDCLFCKFSQGQIPAHIVWENDDFFAFLTIFPNTEGFTVVASKQHHQSDALENDDAILTGLTLASKQVAKKLKKAFPDVGRVGLFLEGFGVDHLHSKLFPMHGTGDMLEWKPIESPEAARKQFFNQYPGYLSSHDGPRADDAKLAAVVEKIKSAK